MYTATRSTFISSLSLINYGSYYSDLQYSNQVSVCTVLSYSIKISVIVSYGFMDGDSPLSQRSTRKGPLSQITAIAMQCINFCILALGSGQRRAPVSVRVRVRVSVSFSLRILFCMRIFAIADLNLMDPINSYK